MTEALFILGGFILLLGGGESLVRGAVALSHRLRLSPTVIGLTVVGFGTSTPELLTSLQAAFARAPGIAVGNVVGSNIANILLIVGAAALVRPLLADRTIARDLWVMLGATALALIVVLAGDLSRLAGLACVIVLATYLTLALRTAPAVTEDRPLFTPLSRTLATLLAGLIATLIGARLLVTGAVDLAAAFGLSQALIGVTIVAVGTSLPELVSSVIAARKGEGGLAIGNVIGSNIFNILGILGLTALVRPIPVPDVIAAFDIWVMVAAALALLILPLRSWGVGRGAGLLLLGAYAAYLTTLAFQV